MKFRIFEQTRVFLKAPPPFGSTDVGFNAIGTVTTSSCEDAVVIAKVLFPKLCRRVAVEPIYEWIPKMQGSSGGETAVQKADSLEHSLS